jgi:hypothetical protein
MSKMAKEMGMSKKSIRNIVHKDLGLLSFKIIQRQYLTDLQKRKKLARSTILLNELKTSTQAGEIVFSDKKLFTVESKINVQNDRHLVKK